MIRQRLHLRMICQELQQSIIQQISLDIQSSNNNRKCWTRKIVLIIDQFNEDPPRHWWLGRGSSRATSDVQIKKKIISLFKFYKWINTFDYFIITSIYINLKK